MAFGVLVLEVDFAQSLDRLSGFGGGFALGQESENAGRGFVVEAFLLETEAVVEGGDGGCFGELNGLLVGWFWVG